MGLLKSVKTEFSFKKLTLDLQVKPFECGDKDLDDFFNYDAIEYSKELLAVTYLIESQDVTVAFFSVLNDKIINKDPSKKKTISHPLARKIPNTKRLESYPAVKIGRFAIHSHYQRQGNGGRILKYIKALFISSNRTGCRFITVDAYNKAVGFYFKNGFKFLTPADEKENTRLMYFDLKTFKP